VPNKTRFYLPSQQAPRVEVTRSEVHPHHDTSPVSLRTQRARLTSDDTPRGTPPKRRELPSSIPASKKGYDILEVVIGEKSPSLIRVFITVMKTRMRLGLFSPSQAYEPEMLEVSTWIPTATRNSRVLDGRSRDAVAEIIEKPLGAYRPFDFKVTDGNTPTDEVSVSPNVPTADSTLGPFSWLVMAGSRCLSLQNMCEKRRGLLWLVGGTLALLVDMCARYFYHRRGGAGTWWVGVVISSAPDHGTKSSALDTCSVVRELAEHHLLTRIPRFPDCWALLLRSSKFNGRTACRGTALAPRSCRVPHEPK
jgi:hypothetical protein